jgi:cell division protein FtsL
MSLRGAVTTVLFLALIGTAIGVVQVRHDGRQRYIELRSLIAERDELNVEYGRLQLEQATWAEMSRVERIAREELGLVRPDPKTVTVVRR